MTEKLLRDSLNEANSKGEVGLFIWANWRVWDRFAFEMKEGDEDYDFAISQIRPLESLIEKAKTYEEKDDIFALVDKLLSLILFVDCAQPESAQMLVGLLECINKHRVLENAIDEMFSKKEIGESDVKNVLEKATNASDDYEKGKLYSGLMHYEKQFDNLSESAKEIMIKFLNKETLESVINFENLNKDQKYNLEILCDLLRLYFNKDTIRILKTAEKIEDPAIAFFSADSLLELDEKPCQETVTFLANNIVYASLIHNSLERNGLIEMFPCELNNSEYIAKSDMVHWLCYPTELGEKPGEIEFLGKAKKHKEEFHIFKFKSNSEKLPEEKHNVWLVGWSGNNGGTFSEFELLSDFEKKTPEKTLKNIIKKCL